MYQSTYREIDAIMQNGSQTHIGRYKADAFIELPASRAADAKRAKIVVESNGAVHHGDARVKAQQGRAFYDTPVLGAYPLPSRLVQQVLYVGCNCKGWMSTEPPISPRL